MLIAASCAYSCPPLASSQLPAPWPPAVAPAVAGSGAVAVEYSAKTQSTAAEDPASGKVAWNTAAQGNATQIFISQSSSGGADTSHIWDNVQAGRSLTIQRKNDAEVIARYTITSVTDNGTWFTINVTPGSNAGLPFANNNALIVTVSAAPIP